LLQVIGKNQAIYWKCFEFADKTITDCLFLFYFLICHPFFCKVIVDSKNQTESFRSHFIRSSELQFEKQNNKYQRFVLWKSLFWINF